MPRLVPQHLKALSTIQQQPKRMTTDILRIIMLDLAGKTNGEIAEMERMSASHLSTIRNCPMYKQQKAVEWAKLRDRVVEKESDKITGDPVENKLKSAALSAAQVKIDLMTDSQNEYVKSGAASDILDRAGYRSQTEKTKVTVQVTEKMANRFERVLGYEPTKNESKTTVRIEEEMS